MTIETTVYCSAKLAWTTPQLVEIDKGHDSISFGNGGPNGDGAPGSAAYNLTS